MVTPSGQKEYKKTSRVHVIVFNNAKSFFQNTRFIDWTIGRILDCNTLRTFLWINSGLSSVYIQFWWENYLPTFLDITFSSLNFGGNFFLIFQPIYFPINILIVTFMSIYIFYLSFSRVKLLESESNRFPNRSLATFGDPLELFLKLPNQLWAKIS